MRLHGFFFALLLTAAAYAADKTPPPKRAEPLPYLGPGSDTMSPEEYRRVYKEYIQQTILLGFPIVEGSAQPCEQAVRTLFRQAGLFNYPVPGDAQKILKVQKQIGDRFIEFYQASGASIQLVRDSNRALERLIYLNTSAPKAARRIEELGKSQVLNLVRDSRTGLEKVQSLPVGYPHPFLDPEGQGIYVKEIRFNKSLRACAPVEYQDNTWTAGYSLSEERCTATQKDADAVWVGKLEPGAFAERERDRMRKAAVKGAMQNGLKQDQAEAYVSKAFQGPFGSDVNIVGTAMRNLTQCSLLAMGGAKALVPQGNPGQGAPAGQGTSSGSAQ